MQLICTTHKRFAIPANQVTILFVPCYFSTASVCGSFACHSLAISSLVSAKADEVLETSDKYLTVADRRGGITRLTKLISRNALKLPAGFDHVHLAVIVYEVDMSLHHDRRSVMSAQFFLPKHLTGGSLVTENRAASVYTEQELVSYHHGWNIRSSFSVGPDDVGFRYIATAIRPDCK